MSKLERELKVSIRKSKINSAIISAVAISGTLVLAAVAPNVLSALSKTRYSKQRKYKLKSSLSRLIQAGYLVLVEEGGKKRLRLTVKGEMYAALLGEGKLVPKKPKRWDGKWRILMFDIPERRRRTRTQVRHTLTALGFMRLQDSVWVYPYDCEDLITLLKADFKLGKDLLYVIADKVEFDTPLRAKFKLV
jgi:DNA-binding transcriptional regulator PaaX